MDVFDVSYNYASRSAENHLKVSNIFLDHEGFPIVAP